MTRAPSRARLAAHPAIANAFIELHGELGAGKTTLVRHLLRALGVQGRIKSPTYAVVEPYELPTLSTIWHFDFYRFNDPREWEDAGFRDIFAGPGLKLAEWPEKAGRAAAASRPGRTHRCRGRRIAARHPAGADAVGRELLAMKRRDLARGGTLVLLLGAQQIARGASILAVRIWPAPDYSRVTIESDAPAHSRSSSS